MPRTGKRVLWVAVHSDGVVEYDAGDCGWQTTKAVPVPPHGRLIDADALMLRVDIHGTNRFGMLDDDIREFINASPTIIPAEEGE